MNNSGARQIAHLQAVNLKTAYVLLFSLIICFIYLLLRPDPAFLQVASPSLQKKIIAIHGFAINITCYFVLTHECWQSSSSSPMIIESSRSSAWEVSVVSPLRSSLLVMVVVPGGGGGGFLLDRDVVFLLLPGLLLGPGSPLLLVALGVRAVRSALPGRG